MNDDDNEENDAEAEAADATEPTEAAKDAEAETPPERTYPITIRGWFNRRPPGRKDRR